MPSKLLFIMLDGCRPDGLLQADTPRLDSVWQSGAYTWRARSVMPCVTLPAHTSIFRGVSPEKHGVKADNIYVSSASTYPSIIEVAKMGNLRTAMFYSWEQLRDISNPGSLDTSYYVSAHYGEDNDTHIAQTAAAHLVEKQPDFCFLYLGDIDINGHLFGWMSPEYISAVEANDRAVGMVLDTLERHNLRERYTILIQADHGGHETDHGADTPEDMTIPWMLNGRHIKQAHEIQQSVSLLDTSATIAHALGLEIPTVWEGKPVHEAFL
jgi:predicted AlkP superfamily pyrophosphatase or phosphodiesterase